MYAGDEFYDDSVTAGALVDEPAPGCSPCTECGFACAVTDEGLCWSCSGELGEAGG